MLSLRGLETCYVFVQVAVHHHDDELHDSTTDLTAGVTTGSATGLTID